MPGRRWWLGVAVVGTSISIVGFPARAASLPLPLPLPLVPNLPPALAPVLPPAVPPIRVPSLPKPSLPTLSVPTPAIPAVGTIGRAPSGSGAQSRGTTSGGGSAVPAAGSAGAAVRSAASGRTSGAGGRSGGAARVGKRDRALRRAVLGLSGCLGRVPSAERRVLVLRAGVGIARTRSRRQVARITGLRRARVATIERRGLRRLRALGRGGGCAAASGPSPVALVGAPPGGTASSGRPTPAAPAARGQVLAEHRSGGVGQRKASAKASTADPPIGPSSGPHGGSASDLRYALLALALAVFAFVLVREVPQGL